MLKASLGFRKISEDVDQFDLEGMVEPTFYNFGTEDVLVYHTILKPGERFLAGVHGMVMTGFLPISFMNNPPKNERSLMCYWGTPLTVCDEEL